MALGAGGFLLLPVATLSSLISVIVGVRAEEEMGRIYTVSNVAMMQNVEICGEIAAKERPCDTMGPASTSVPDEETIAIFANGSGPMPTTVGRADNLRA